MSDEIKTARDIELETDSFEKANEKWVSVDSEIVFLKELLESGLLQQNKAIHIIQERIKQLKGEK